MNRAYYSTSALRHESIWAASTRVEAFAKRPITPVSLEYLLALGVENRLGVAQYVHNELPVRLARRVKGIVLVLTRE